MTINATNITMRVGAGGVLENIQLPRFSISSLNYVGSFRIPTADNGIGISAYATGTIAYNSDNHSLFLAGHETSNVIAEFGIPTLLDVPAVSSLNNATVLQNYTTALDRVANTDGIDRITGMFYKDGQLILNAENWYPGTPKYDTTLVFRDSTDIANCTVDGWYELSSGAQGAGFISPVPEYYQSRIGKPYICGWASNYSIASRYSIGPSMWTFDADTLLTTGSTSGAISNTALINYPYGSDNTDWIVPDALVTGEGPGIVDAIWNYVASATFGMIIPGTRTYAVFGTNGGVNGGIGYKITQDTGNVCGGYCTYLADEVYNYYWLFDVDEVLSAANTSDPLPYDHGVLDIPLATDKAHSISGGTYNETDGIIYLTIDAAGQLGSYDIVPIIAGFTVN